MTARERNGEVRREARGDDRRGDAVLWASACVVAALLVIQAGRPDAGPNAMDPLAGAAAAAAPGAAVDGFSVVPARSGRGDDADPNEVVWVLDSRSESIMVYEIEDARRGGVIFREGANLRSLFQAARR